MRAASPRKGEFFRARSPHQPRKPIVSFDAAGLVIKSVLLIALSRELLLDRPRPHPHGRIFDRDDVFERRRPGAPPTLDQMQVLTRALIIGFRTEVRHVDYKRITLPMATRVAIPLAYAGRQMRASIHDDVALPPLALPDVVEDRDAARSLHDAPEAAGRGSELGQSAGQAAIRQLAVLRTIMAIHARGVV